MKMKIKVTTPMIMLLVNGVPVRTPCEIDIKNKTHLEFMQTYLRTKCAEYDIINEDELQSVPELIIKTSQKI